MYNFDEIIDRRHTNAMNTGLMSHKPVDLLILMLGTNDAKEWYGASPERICAGMEYLVCRAQNIPECQRSFREKFLP